MSDWTTIDESAASQPILLRGIPVTVPKSYAKPASPKLTLATLAHALWRVTSWSGSLLGHLVLMVVLVGIVSSKPAPKELLVQLSLSKGDQGEHGKQLAEARPVPEPEPDPKPVVEAEPEPEKPEPKLPPIEDPKAAEIPKPAGEVAKKGSDTVGSASGTPGSPDKESKEGGGSIETDPTSATAARRAGDLAKLRRGGAAEIVVVAGAYDHVEKVLAALAIPHTLIDHTDLARHDLAGCRILLVNCHSVLTQAGFSSGQAQKMKAESERVAKQIRETERRLEEARKSNHRSRIRELEAEVRGLREAQRQYDRLAEVYQNAGNIVANVRRFVEGGGYLFTSDWGISLLEKAFPDMVSNGGDFGPRSVGIAPRKEAPFLDGVFAKRGTTARELKWEIDSGSYLIRVKSNRVQVLVESRQLPSHRAVAVVFAPTDTSGRVLHVLSHFAKQEDAYGEFALQNLLLNFILERVEK